MVWNWQWADWPRFSYDAGALEPLEQQFLLKSGELSGALRHVGREDRGALRIELISDEAVKTSQIEGEILNRDSVQSSLRHQFGLGPEEPNIPPAERGIAKMMVDLYEHFNKPLSDETMFAWRQMLLAADTSIKTFGGYRTHDDPMQVVSGPIHKRAVHFEAPSSKTLPVEMERFVSWFNQTAP
jgi:Fic family protein